jgi:hypothetical protein
MVPAGVAVVARGQTGRALAYSAGCMVLTLAGMAVLRPASAMQAVLVWCGAQMVMAPYALWINGRAMGTGPLRPLRAGMLMAGVTAAGLAAAAAMPADVETLAGLALRLAVFVAVVLAGMAMGSRWRGTAAVSDPAGASGG